MVDVTSAGLLYDAWQGALADAVSGESTPALPGVLRQAFEDLLVVTATAASSRSLAWLGSALGARGGGRGGGRGRSRRAGQRCAGGGIVELSAGP
ncbi:MAG: hypothetical protein R2734_11330 [Nocardioides sp.]